MISDLQNIYNIIYQLALDIKKITNSSHSEDIFLESKQVCGRKTFSSLWRHIVKPALMFCLYPLFQSSWNMSVLSDMTFKIWADLAKNHHKIGFCNRKLMRTDIFFTRTTKPICNFVNPVILFLNLLILAYFFFNI